MTSNFFRSLRFRLAFWNTLVVLLASLLALLAVREGLRLTLLSETFDVLRDEIRELELAISELHPDAEAIRTEFERKAEGHRDQGWFVELLDPTGKVVFKSPRFPELTTPLPFRSSIQFRQQDETLLAWRQIERPGIPGFRIVLGTPDAFIQRSFRGLTRSMWWIGAGLCLLAPVGGYLLAWWAIRPVREIIETTRTLQPKQMTRRLPIRDTGDELDQLSGEINNFLDQIARYISSQQEFTANAAHELRSPLTAIQTSVEVTLEKERTEPEYREQLETVSEQCAQLRHLVNQLLELSDAETQQTPPPLKPFNLSDLVAKSAEFFSGIAEDSRIRIVTRIQPNVCWHGYADRMRQVVNNLLDNALKFTPPDGCVTVGLVQAAGQIILTVEDTGSGIPEAEKNKVFDRFYQVELARQRDDGRRGNGLGLSICRAIVELHHGEIGIQDVDPHGARFVVRFTENGIPPFPA